MVTNWHTAQDCDEVGVNASTDVSWPFLIDLPMTVPIGLKIILIWEG